MNLFQQLEDGKRYSEYRRRIDPQKVLDYYGARNSFEIQKENGDLEVQHSCLIDKVIPHHTHGDENPSARMNLDKKLYVCYSFGGGDIFWLIKTLEEKETFSEILPVVGQFLDGATVDKKEFLKELEGYFEKGEVDSPLPVYSERVLEQWAFTHPYLLKQRGISHEAAKRLRVGYDDNERRIVFPLFFNKKLVGWQKRAVPDGLGYPPTLPDVHGNLAKYKNTSGFPKSQVLYNLDLVKERGRRSVVLVESPMSCLKAETLTNGEDLLSGVIATFGAKVSESQLELLRGFESVYIFMDSDPAGVKAAERICRSLYRHVVCYVVQPQQDMDLADYDDRHEVLEKIKSAEPAFMALARWDHGKSTRRRR